MKKWNLYIAAWGTGHISYYVMSEDETDWGYLLDAEGDPSEVIVKKIDASKMNSISFHQSKPNGKFNGDAFGAVDSLKEIYDSSTKIVWPNPI